MAVVVAHGAGSSGAAACALLGLPCADGIIRIEDRSGEIDRVIAGIDAAVEDAGPDVHVIGVSMGAHAAARWAAARSSLGPMPVAGITCVLPAWCGPPGGDLAALATAQAGADIARVGKDTMLDSMRRAPESRDVLRLVELAWADYSDEQLASCLLAASQGVGPQPHELQAINAPVAIVGWEHDALHSGTVARTWNRHLQRPRLALAARPEIRLLQDAMTTVHLPARSRRG
jgi:pimeloyl-ACP methyl ester carboxylesterase